MDTKEYKRQYYLKNKEKYNQRNNDYKEQNKEKLKEKSKEYYLKNKEKINEYRKTEKGRKVKRISDWRKRGVVSNNFDELYDYYLSVSVCENCGCELDKCNKSRKCLDHDHTTGLFRNVLCHYCNFIRG